MALARVVRFSGVTDERIEELRQQIGEQGRPDEVPAGEIMCSTMLTGSGLSRSSSSTTRMTIGAGRSAAGDGGGRDSGQPDVDRQIHGRNPRHP